MAGSDLWYIDGFAGPGEYENAPKGSPIAALSAAENALKNVGANWKAGKIHCVFIEQDKDRLVHLQQLLQGKYSQVERLFFESSFVDGLAQLRNESANPFSHDSPLFTFIDPFGAKGVPFSEIKSLLSQSTSEVLINLDSDGVARIFLAEDSSNYEEILDEVFGDADWRTVLPRFRNTTDLYRGVLALYKERLLTIPGVRYVFAFEMRSTGDSLNYHLVFASKHPLGLAKMKEAMKKIAQNGEYVFSDARIGQTSLFRFDDPATHSQDCYDHFRGRSATYDEMRDYALNESPFVNPKAMLKILEQRGLIEVSSSNAKRRVGTFSEDHLICVRFI